MKLTDEQLEFTKKWMAKCEEKDEIPTNGMTIGRLLEHIEALQQENEQLQAQTARMREALETILREFDKFGNRRDGLRAWQALDMAKAALSDTPAEYHNPADVAALKKAREALETVTEHLENCYGRDTPDTEKAREVLAAIDKIGGREDV